MAQKCSALKMIRQSRNMQGEAKTHDFNDCGIQYTVASDNRKFLILQTFIPSLKLIIHTDQNSVCNTEYNLSPIFALPGAVFTTNKQSQKVCFVSWRLEARLLTSAE
jgi:hypothetical protein